MAAGGVQPRHYPVPQGVRDQVLEVLRAIGNKVPAEHAGKVVEMLRGDDEDGDAQEVEDSTTAEQPEDDAVCAVPLRTLFAVMLGTLVSPSPPASPCVVAAPPA